ncbi:non-ribosomal peptide synthetase, partial [Rhizobium rhizogenes]|uniref:non-ribosomal peptide synthetase n=1 Tax=Rhizobium rhizogenes TaxID=359 RepID=UPI00157305F0
TILLDAAVKDPLTSVARLPLMTPQQKNKILRDWNMTEADYPAKPLHVLFEEQASRSPNAAALITDDGESVSYGDLDWRSNKLAHYLRGAGVAPEVRVGVFLERSIDMVISLLAISKAGGAYVPIDPRLPRIRRDYILGDAGVELVLSATSYLADLPDDVKLVLLDRDHASINDSPSTSAEVQLHPDNLFYVLHTSGSTGRPKGVMISHRGIAACVKAMQDLYRLKPSDRFLMKTSLNFDPSVWELFWPLAIGASVVLARADGDRDPIYLAHLVERHRTTAIYFVPSMLSAFLDVAGKRDLSSLQHIICGGEKLPSETLQKLQQRLQVTLHHSYGPTETSIAACEWKASPAWVEATVPMGYAIANTRLYVLDRTMEPVQIGVSGELYVGGDGVGRGYIGRPGLTAERFIPDPFDIIGGGRLYRTGDRVRRRPDGMLEFLGRVDQQIKLHGLRIEIGEIEAALMEHPGVLEAIVTLWSDTPESPRLVAYVTLSSITAPTDLRSHLRERLPDTMVPSTYLFLDAFPRTPGGKIDRGALPAPVEDAPSERVGALPRTAAEKRAASLWEAVLRQPDIRRDDDFFALGGHSLLATQVIARINDELDVHLQVRDIFERPILSDFAALLERLEPKLSPTPPGIARLPRQLVKLGGTDVN